MRRSRLCAALTLCGLLAFATSAGAECAWVLWQYPYDPSKRLGMDDPRVVAIHREVARQYSAGRSTGFSPDEMLTLAKLHFGNALATSTRS